MSTSTVTPLAAATVMLLRDGGRGLEVFMLERNPDSGWVPGAYLFPGGAVDLDDGAPTLAARCRGRDDATASTVTDTLRAMDKDGFVKELCEKYADQGMDYANWCLA